MLQYIQLARQHLPPATTQRAPGKRMLAIFGEIVEAHKAGRRWFPRAPGVVMGALASQTRVRHVQQLAKQYGWIVGNARDGWRCAVCPVCANGNCFGMRCKEE